MTHLKHALDPGRGVFRTSPVKSSMEHVRIKLSDRGRLRTRVARAARYRSASAISLFRHVSLADTKLRHNRLTHFLPMR